MKLIVILTLFSTLLFSSIGKVLIVKGDLKVERDSKESTLKTGDLIELKDKLSTLPKSKAQIKFYDGTIITIGNNSHLEVEDFINEGKNSIASFKVKRGFFKTITGEIGKINPDKFKLKTKTSTIGIRGTIFAGMIEEVNENIACLEGAISVKANGKEVFVNAGEITSITQDLAPSTPREFSPKEIKAIENRLAKSVVMKEINSLKLEKGEIKFNRSKIDSIVSNILEIENEDDRREAVASLNDTLYKNFHQALSENLYKVEVPLAYKQGYSSTESNYSPLDWGYYTLSEVNWDKTSFESSLASAGPAQVWLEPKDSSSLEDARTASSTIENYIGKTSSDEIARHWDGSVESKKVIEYQGKVLAVTDANSEFTDEGYPTDYTLLTATDGGLTTNEVYLKVDYGNKISSGYMKFFVKDPITNESKSWYLHLFNIDNENLTAQEISFNAMYHMFEDSSSDQKLYITDSDQDGNWDKLTLMDLRYYGELINQIAGTFNLFNSDGSVTYGTTILNNQELTDSTKGYTYKKSQIGSDSSFSWGYWSEKDLIDNSEESILASNPTGGWIEPTTSNTTPESFIESQLTEGTTASYTGNIIGSVHGIQSKTTEIMSNGVSTLEFNYNTKQVTGTLDFDAGDKHWSINVGGSTLTDTITATGFNLKSFSNGANHNAGTIFYGSGDGNFYGEGAGNIGGGFKAQNIDSSKNIQIAVGAITGNKE